MRTSLSLSFSPRDLLNHSDEKDVLTVGGESFRLRVDNGSGGGELELYEVEGRKEEKMSRGSPRGRERARRRREGERDIRVQM